MPSILFPAKTDAEGARTFFTSKPTTAAAPAIAAPAKNLRRFKYKLFGVISDERMSSALLISIRTPPEIRATAPWRIWLIALALYFFTKWDARRGEKLQARQYCFACAECRGDPIPGLLG